MNENVASDPPNGPRQTPRSRLLRASASRTPASPRARATIRRRHQAAGMLFGDFVRSPYAHARINSIDKEAALGVPGVVAVLTAEDLKPLNLHWMPTLAGDVQAVLADEKVLFQGQEVAFVVAEDRYAAADAVELVEVEYEELPVLTNPSRRWTIGRRCCARTSRTRRKAPTGRASITTTSSPGNRATGGHRSRQLARPSGGRGNDHLSRHPPLPAGDLRLRRLHGQGQRQADALGHLPGAARGAHRGLADFGHRGAQYPHRLAGYRRRFRQQGRRLSGLYLRRRGLDRDRSAGEVGRGPDGEPDRHRLCPRLPHDRQDRGHQGRQDHRPAGATCWPTTAPSTPAPTRPSSRPASSTSAPAPTTSRWPIWPSTASIPTRRRAGSPIAVPSG